MKRTRAIRAFTLIELLVVIVILGILAALLFPALSRARSHATAIECLSHLRQWGIAVRLFAVGNDDYLPTEGKPTPLESDLSNPSYQAWYIQLPAQIGLPKYASMPWRTNPAVRPGNSIWICPNNPRRCDSSSRTNNLFHYCLNDEIDGTGGNDRAVQIGSVNQPCNVIYLFDTKNLPAVGASSFVHTNLHSRGADFLFLDGHAARYGSSAYWDFSRRRAITNNPELVWSP